MRLEIPQHKVTLSGNTAGVLQIVSSGTLTLAGGNNITLSQAGNAITISGANVGGAQTGISGIIASDATYTSGTVEFVGAGIITIASAGGQQVVVSATQSVQPETQTFIGGIGNSETTYTSGTVRLSELGAITIRSTTGNQFQFSVNAQSVQPETQTFIGGIANTETTYTSGTVKILELGAVTFRSTTGNQFQISVNSQSVQPETQTFLGGLAASDKTYTSGTVVLTGAGQVTVQSNAGQTITINVAAQTAESQSIGMSNLGNTSGTTGIASGAQVRFLLAGGNNITLSQSLDGASGTITISAFNQTGTQFSAGLSNIGNTAGDTVTVGGRLILAGGNGITLSGSSNGVSQTITISGVTQSVESQSIGMSNVGNTAGTSGMASGGQVRIVIGGTSNITVSQSLNGASATLSLIGNPSMSAGVSNVGNTSGDTGITGTRLVLAGGNNITLSQSTNASGGTVTISAPNLGAGAMSAGASNLGNTAGSTGITGTQLVLVGSGVMSLSQSTGANGGTLSILAPATSSLTGVSGVSVSTNGSTISIFETSGGPTVRQHAPFSAAPQTFLQQGQATLHVQPMTLALDLLMDRVMFAGVVSNASNSSNSITITNAIGIYTRNASTLSLVTSVSTSTNFSGSGTVGSYSLYGGRRWMTAALTTTLSKGEYWVAILHRSTTGGGAGHSVSQICMTQNTNATFSNWSGVLGAATNATRQSMLGFGVYTVSTLSAPNAIQFSEINGTGSLAVMPPVYMLRSGTI